jgi:uncharacterized protein YjdB
MHLYISARNLRALFMLSLLFFVYSGFSQDTIYIDPSYSGGTENGSITYPYNSWGDFSIESDNAYLQRSGTVSNENITLRSSYGSNIYIGTYGGSEKAAITSKIYFDHCTNVVFENYKLSGTDIVEPLLRGIEITEANYVTINNFEVTYTYFGVVLEGNNITISNTEIHDARLDGMVLSYADTILIENVYIHNINTGYYGTFNSGGDGIQALESHNVTVKNSIFDRTNSGNKFGIIATGTNSNWVIDGCYFSGPIVPGDGRGAGIHIGANNLIVKNSVFENCPTGIYNIVPEIYVSHCLFVSNVTGIALGGGTATIYNSTFYDNNTAVSGGSDSDIQNNIIYLTSSSQAGYVVSPSDFVNNIQNIEGRSFDSDLSSDQLRLADPEFISALEFDFHVSETSSAQNSGNNIGVYADIDGTPIDSNIVDLGIHEYDSAETYNLRPEAIISGDSTIVAFQGDTIWLQGSASFDPDGDALSFTWTANCINSFSSLTDENPYLVLENSTSPIVLSLVVHDGTEYSKRDIKRIDLNIPVSNIDLWSSTGQNLVINTQTLQLLADVSPDNALDTTIAWSVTNLTGSASISQTGLLTPQSNGTVEITASATDGSRVSESIIVEIVDEFNLVEDIIISHSNGSNDSLDIGSSLQMYAEVLPSNATNQNISWGVNNVTGIATIDNDGMLQAITPGFVDIIAFSQDGSGTQSAKRIHLKDTMVYAESISLWHSGDNDTIDLHEYLQFFAQVNPSDASVQNVTYSIINTSGSAEISEVGLLLPLSVGEVEVVATATDGSGVNISYSIYIEQGFVPVESISLWHTNDNDTLLEGDELQFYTQVLPVNASDTNLYWLVTNGTGLAAINQDGLLTAYAEGTVTVEVRSTDSSNITEVYNLFINPLIVPVESIAIWHSNFHDTLKVNDTLQFFADITPSHANDTSIVWILSQGSGIASIGQNGILHTFLSGTVEVSANSMDGSDVSASRTIIVRDDYYPVESIALWHEKGSEHFILPGEQLQFHCSIFPEIASNQSVEWLVQSIDSIATINSEGLLTGLSEGVVTVLVYCNDNPSVSSYISIEISDDFLYHEEPFALK